MKLDSAKTALMTLDLQKEILASVPESEPVMPSVSKALEIARLNRFQIIHLRFGFSEGRPEIPAADFLFSRAT